MIDQFRFGERHLRSGRNVHHTVAVAQVVQHVRDVLVLRACEDVHVHAQLAQAAGQLADIHVHSAGVFTAQGGQGTGVVGKHGYVDH